MSFFSKTKNKSARDRNSQLQSGRAVFSYYQNRVIPGEESVKATAEREKKTQSASKRYHIPTILVLLVIVGCFLYSLTLDQNPKIIVVNEQDQSTKSLLRPIETYQQAAQKILQDSPMNKTKITANTAGLARTIKEHFPEISDASISLPLINRRPVFYLLITQPVFLMTKGSEIYALDQQGRVIMKGDETLPASDLVKIDDQTAQEPVVGEQFLPASQIAFLQNVQAQLADKGITEITFILPTLANEVYIKLPDKPYLVKMTFANDPRLQAGTFLATKQQLEKDRITPTEYIDARVEEHAYYK